MVLILLEVTLRIIDNLTQIWDTYRELQTTHVTEYQSSKAHLV